MTPHDVRRLERVELDGPVGRLAGLLHRPAGDVRFAAVVSHPHPLFGGTMDNKVVYRVARALEDAGAIVLRYDFRGAGGSEGVHDGGRGERDDLRAAIAFLRRKDGDGVPLLLAGFSFGAAMSVSVGCADPDVVALLLVGLPATRLPEPPLLDGCAKPIAFVHGERDVQAPLAPVRALAEAEPRWRSLHVIAGAGHFFDAEQAELYETVSALVSEGGDLAPALRAPG